MIEKNLVIIIKVLGSRRVEGWPEGGELPVQGGGGDQGGHEAAERHPSQDAAPQSRRPHHPRHPCLVSVNTPGVINHHYH